MICRRCGCAAIEGVLCDYCIDILKQERALEIMGDFNYLVKQHETERKELAGKGSALDMQVAGGHYKKFKIQPIEFVHANKLDFIQGSIIKYICRFRDKNGKQDLEKIKHFVDLLIELEYKEEEVDSPK